MYIKVKVKFFIVFCISLAWFIFCTWLSLPWISDLSVFIGPFAYVVIGLIALIPGFMNSFLFFSYLMDSRPKAKNINDWVNISILIPAFNEENSIKRTIDAILRQDYPGEIQIIAIDNNSQDKTLEILKSLDVHNLLVLEEKQKGKSHALNTGLAAAVHDIIISIDSDTELWHSALREIVSRFLSTPANTVAVAGSIYVKNSRTNFMTKIQEWDYFNAIATIKRMQSLFQGTLVAQGAFSLYKKSSLLEQGGWPHTVGEDIVLSWGFLCKGYRIDFAEDAIAFTNVPTTYRQFFYQRSRWARGMIEAFTAHPQVLIMPRMITFVVYWNLLFPAIDVTFTLFFIPGLVAAFFGYFLIVGPMTLAVLPLTLLMNTIFFIGQKKMFLKNNLKVRRNWFGAFCYSMVYYMIMVPSCIHGYLQEIMVAKKKWGTK